jgi:hypothetical protein
MTSIVILCLQAIPLWVFLFPLLLSVGLAIRFWIRPVTRNVCIYMAILITVCALPVCAVQAWCRTGGGTALERRFGHLIDPDRVVKYRFVVAGIGDTCEFWKLKGVDARSCQQIIDEHNLKPVAPDPTFLPGSTNGAPWWWSDSTKGYTVSEGDDGAMGSIEIWIAEDHSTVYLHRFIE